MATAVYDANDFERMIRQFLAHIDVERGLSKATVSAYGADLKKYRQWLANRGINDITSVTTQDVENYVAFLDESGESARSKARRLASIHAFHRFAVDEHSVADNVSAQVKAPKGASTLPDVLAIDEVARLLEAIPVSQNRAHGGASLEVPDDPVMLRDKALLEFMYATGARVSEACGANLDDVDTESRIARLMGKGSKQRLVPVVQYWSRSQKALRSVAPCFSTSADEDCRDSRFGRSSGLRGNVRTSTSRCILIRCVILSPRILSKAVPTCVPCRNCLGMQASPPRRYTRTSARRP